MSTRVRRMSQPIRYHVLNGVLQLFKDDEARLENQLAERKLGYQLYMNSLPEEVKNAINTLKSFDDSWIQTTKTVRVTIYHSIDEEGKGITYEEYLSERIPYCGFGYGAKVTITPKHAEYAKAEDLLKQYRQQETDREILKAEVLRILNEAKTVEDLCTVWHTASVFLPPDIRISNKRRRGTNFVLPTSFSDEAAAILMRQMLAQKT